MLASAITDLTGVPTAGALQPRIYFRKNAGSYFSTQCALASGTATSGSLNCTVDNALVGGVAVGDVIDYFLIAQDTVATPNLGSNPAGVIAPDVNTVSTPPGAPNSYSIVAPSPLRSPGTGCSPTWFLARSRPISRSTTSTRPTSR